MKFTASKILCSLSLLLSSSFLVQNVVQAQPEQDFIINEQGTLTVEDEVLENGQYLDIYEVETQPNEELVILIKPKTLIPPNPP